MHFLWLVPHRLLLQLSHMILGRYMHQHQEVQVMRCHIHGLLHTEGGKGRASCAILLQRLTFCHQILCLLHMQPSDSAPYCHIIMQ